MDFFKEIEKECKRIEREKNKRMKDFVTRQVNVILNMKYISDEVYYKKLNSLFSKKNDYKIDLEELINSIDEIIEPQMNVTTNGEVSESQRTFSNNNYELNLLLTLEEKNDFIQWFKEFEYKFNSLEEIERKLIYYSFVEKENNVWLALKINYCERTITTLKTKAINEFYRQLKLGELTSKEFLQFNHIKF